MRLIAPFRRVISRDEDRSKRNAAKDFGYIYFMADYKSPYMAYPEEERSKRIHKDLDIKGDYSKDETIKEAVEKYRELNETPSIKTLNAVRETLLTTNSVINKLRKKIDESLIEYEEMGEADTLLNIVNSLKALLDLGDKIPKTITTVDNMYQKVIKEAASSNAKIIGGGDVGDFEN